MKTIKINDKIELNNHSPITLIAGPCALESESHALHMSSQLMEIADRCGIPFIYKTSFYKANRTSIKSPRGVGFRKGVPIFEKIRNKIGCPILTDIHEEWHCKIIKDVVDVIQIPVFLSRQTDLIVEATRTNLPINIKKGQFLAPKDMVHVVEKVEHSHEAFELEGNPRIILTDRGTSFGYNTLVSDMRALPIMAQTGYPVVFDATHSVQQPGGLGGKSGGERQYVEVLARAAVAVGVAGVFMEVHDDPDNAVSDGPNMIPLDKVEGVIKRLMEIDKVVKNALQR
jgi:2-dehydro-3-deoxyphosphooctonate aldolase (KDO 8-P synthase)